MAELLVTLPAKQVAWVPFPVPARPMFSVEKVALFCNPASGGKFSSPAIEIIKWVKNFAVAQAKVTHILRPGKASGKTPKGVIPTSLCEISQNASRKKTRLTQRHWTLAGMPLRQRVCRTWKFHLKCTGNRSLIDVIMSARPSKI
jgi:hypothetical protein